MARKKKRKFSARSWTRKLDALWSQLIKRRDGYRCRWCGRSADKVQLQSHHLHGRQYRSTRWLLDNGCCLCAKCHRRAETISLIFAEFIQQDIGTERYRALLAAWQPITEMSPEKYRQAEDCLQAAAASLKQTGGEETVGRDAHSIFKVCDG